MARTPATLGREGIILNTDRPGESVGPGPLALVAIPVAYFLGAKIGVAFTVMPEGVAIIWPPNSILLAALLRYDGRGWGRLIPLVIVAEVLADFPTFTVGEALLFGLINVAEASIAFVLLRRMGFDRSFKAIEDLLKFTLAAPVAAASVAALGGAATYSLFRGGATGFFDFLFIWWFGDALGLAILTPMFLRLWLPALHVRVTPRPFRPLDLLIAIAGIIVLGLSIRTAQVGASTFHLDPVIAMPFVLHFCARFGARYAALVVGGVALVLVVATTHGWAIFAGEDPRIIVVQTQEYLFIMTLMGIGLAELVEQYRFQGNQLQAAKQDLEQRVEERTDQLRRANDALEVRVAERTERLRELNTRLLRYAMTDPLTDLPNRRAMVEALTAHIARARREQESLLVLIVDMDGLKSINDRHGHHVGDAAIQAFARAIQKSVRTGDMLSRTGGDEFVVFGSARHADDAIPLGDRILDSVRAARVEVEGQPLPMTASIGITMLDVSDASMRETLRRADEALYQAKRNGRDQYVVRFTTHPVGGTESSPAPQGGTASGDE